MVMLETNAGNGHTTDTIFAIAMPVIFTGYKMLSIDRYEIGGNCQVWSNHQIILEYTWCMFWLYDRWIPQIFPMSCHNF